MISKALIEETAARLMATAAIEIPVGPENSCGVYAAVTN